MKKILIGTAVVVVLVIGAVVYLASNANDLIKKAVENVGSKATGATVTLSNVDISLTDGDGTLSGLRVGNPSGFKSDYAFDLGAVSVSVDTGSVTSNPIIIKKVVVKSPKLIYELAGGGSNIDAIRKNVEAFAKSMNSGDGSSDEASEGEGGKKVVIDDLYVRGGNVSVSAGFLNGKPLGTPLPEIHLKDIGKKEGGASPAEVASKVITAITSEIGGAVSKLDLKGMMKDAAGAAVGQAQGAADNAAKATGDAAGGAADAIKDATKGITNMLGN